jgi:hypothetical protein
METRRASSPLICTFIYGGSLLLAACSGNGSGLDANGNPADSGSAVPELSADFDSLQANVFTPICSVCHVGGAAPEGLRLDAADSYNLLVGVPSTEVPSLMRVNPGDPDNSYLIQKLEGTAAVGERMPRGGPYLSTETIAFIRQWITNGAPPSATAAALRAAPFAITAVVPDDSEPVSASPPQIMIAFNRDLDVSQINLQTARLEKLAPGVPESITEVIPARILVSNENLKALMLWPGRVLAVGHYRLVIHSDLPQLFTSTTGESISGAQNDAGEFVIGTFDVEALP